MHRVWLIVLALLFNTGCFAVGVYRTAHSLPEGEGDLSLTFSYNRLVDNQGADIAYPNVIPEISYHFGVTDDVEVGGRAGLGSGLLEVDTKVRFVGGPQERFHMAVQPAAGYRSLFLIQGYHVALPLIMTYDFTDKISMNFAAFGSFTQLEPTEDDLDADISGSFLIGGGSLGVQFETSTGFHFMPAIEFQRTAVSVDNSDSAFSNIMGVIVFGWGANEKLNKMDEKLDRIEDKLDRLSERE